MNQKDRDEIILFIVAGIITTVYLFFGFWMGVLFSRGFLI